MLLDEAFFVDLRNNLFLYDFELKFYIACLRLSFENIQFWILKAKILGMNGQHLQKFAISSQYVFN